MNDDDLLQALGELAREREGEAVRGPDLWSRLARGELSPDEAGDLEARAASDAPLDLSLRAYRPLADDVRERIVDALSASLAQPAAAPVAPALAAVAAAAPVAPAPAAVAAAAPVAPAPAPAPAPTAAPAPAAEIISLDARRRRLLRLASPLAATAAAAAALWALAVRPPDRPDVAPLPSYELVARGGLKQTRGPAEAPAAGPLRLSPSSELDLTLRPATQVEGPLALRAFVLRNNDVRPLAAPVDVAPTGALRLRGAAGELLPGLRGPVELRLVVGRSGALGGGDDLKRKALSAEGSGPGWQTLRYAIELVDAPE